MCGIAGGIWHDPGSAIEPATLERMIGVLRHRGPDDAGTLWSQPKGRGYDAVPGVALGHRRLAVLDVACGRQPLANEDGSVSVVFNGEIYNYVDLRRRLEGAGHKFRTQSDTETIVHLYEDEGLDFLTHLDGMFALALWDSNQRRLVLARDRLGKKPLVYRVEPGRLLFASELKSLLKVPGVRREIDPQALDEYLTYQYVPHPRTIFRGIHKLPPAHFGVYRDGRWTSGCYWRPDFDCQIERPFEDYADELRELLTSAVKMRLQSDVPLGAFLSGGIDSTLVVGLMQKLSDRPVKTFSIGFSVDEFDETKYARLAAQHFGTEHHEFRVEPRGLEVLPKLLWHYDEPFGDSSAIPTYYVSKLSREHVTVALTGDGGDELFAGYSRYQAVRLGAWFDRLPRPLRFLLAGPHARLLGNFRRQKSFWRRLGRFAGALGQSPQRRYLDWMSIFDERRRAQLYTDAFVEQLPDADPFGFLAAAFARSAHRDAVTAASLADLVTYLPCDLLTKVDIAAMAHGLECRQPFLDRRVVELAVSMPVAYKLGLRRGKRILRQAFADFLPKPILRRSKMGFGVPLAHWFRAELKDFSRQVLLDPQATSRGAFRPGAVAQLLEEHQAGIFDHSQRLWSLLVLEMWQREWIDGAPATSGAGAAPVAGAIRSDG